MFVYNYTARCLGSQNPALPKGSRIMSCFRFSIVLWDSILMPYVPNKAPYIVRSIAAGHVVQNSNAQVARSVAAIWALLLFK